MTSASVSHVSRAKPEMYVFCCWGLEGPQRLPRARGLGTILWKPPLDGLEFLRWLLMAIKGLLTSIKGLLMAINEYYGVINGY